MNLTDEQRRFAEHGAEAFVEACPGAGKTRTILARLAHVGNTLPPRRGVAVLSFTNKAIEEFKARSAEVDVAHLLRHPGFIGTFDAFVRQFLFAPTGVEGTSLKPHVVESWDSLLVEIRLAKGQAFRGPGVSLDLFDPLTNTIDPRRVGHAGLQRHVRESFAFTGMIRCASCGCSITAEEHTKPSGLTFVYYRCTRKKLVRCIDPAIALRDLESQIMLFLKSITVADEVHRWVLARLDRSAREDKGRNLASRQSIETALQAVNQQIENLRKLRVRDLLSDEEFVGDRETLQNERLKLTQQLNSDESPGDWIEPARMLILFSNRAVSWFLEGNHEIQRLILAVAGLNPRLSDRQLNIDAKKPFRKQSGANDFLVGWSIVKDVRTRWQAHDQELVETVAAIRRLKELVEPAEAARAA
jgi:hypothetical protein